MKATLSLLLLFAISYCNAQRQNVYFLKNDGRYVNVRDSADFVRVVREPDSASVLYNVLEFYPDGKTKLVGKSAAIDPPKFEGQCLSFYPDGKKKVLTTYKKGIKVGIEYEFYNNGKIYMVKDYPGDGITAPDFKDNYLIKENYDSIGTALVANGNGYFKGFNTNFDDISEEGLVKDGKREGQWKGNSKKLEVTFTETYENGILVNGTAIYKDGKSIPYTTSRKNIPQFKGGMEAFYKYLSHTIRYPKIDREKNIQGRTVIGFVVDKEGNIHDVKIMKSVSPDIDEEAMRVIRNSPPWLPGTMFGLPVKVAYSVPIAFSLAN